MAGDHHHPRLLHSDHDLQGSGRLFHPKSACPTQSADVDGLQQVVEAGIIRYFFNSVIVTVGAVIPLVLFSFLASYAIVRGESRLLRFSRSLFLLGLAIPLQATIIPIYLIITRIHMYDTLEALILPFDRLRDPALGVDLEQLHPRRTPGAVRVNAARRLHRLADGVAPGVPADQTGNRDSQHL
jgi:hypothetical protein